MKVLIATTISLAMIVLILGACATKKSEQELESIDKFIEQYEEEIDDSRGSVTAHSVSDNSDISDINTNVKRDTDDMRESATTASETTRTAEELASEVINHGINGDEREAYLGDRYKEVQEWIDENYQPPIRYSETEYYPSSDSLTPDAGVVYYDGHMETYYNLDMSGVLDIMYSLGYSGDYWVRYDGCKMFGDYIMCAADFNWLPRGSVVLTSLGWAIVCDTGSGGSNWIDIAVTW